MVEKRDNAFPAASLRELGDEVALRGRVGRIESGEAARIVKGKALVMTGGEGDVAHAALAGEAGDGGGIELLRREFTGQLRVGLDRDFLLELDPLALAEVGVEAPVEEEAVAEAFKSGNAGEGLGDRGLHRSLE